MSFDAFERWPELDELFARALDLPPGERDAFLNERYAGDPDLRRELARLIAEASDPDPGLEDPVVWVEGVLSPRVPGPADGEEGVLVGAGTVVGPYRILRELGAGGMGVVYLAERADGEFRQRVALKVIRSRLAGRDEVERFRRERQILADLRHPNIARLLDGGVAEDGRPYFVMERVRGRPIDRYCDEERLEVAERLELFRTVCAAVHHAHQKLAVHRDLKPANVLVTRHGTPKLLDFGIAKLLAPDDGGESDDLAQASETRTGVRLMTPEYASPEQIDGRGITTATDVWQLGVLLYEILTGHRPFRAGAGGLSELERTIRTTPPSKPSDAVVRRPSDAAGAGEPAGAPEPVDPVAIAAARGTSPDRLRRRLRGDLDTIVLKAMRREPERRYRSARELEEDLERYATGHPVQARPDTFSYRSARFIRRHRWGVGAAVAAVLALAGFGAAMARQAALTARENRTAVAVTEFLTGLFREADPDLSSGLTLREVLDAGATRVRRELEGEPDVQAKLLGVIGEAYRGLGLLDEAQPLLEDALAMRTARLPPDHPDVAEGQNALGLYLWETGRHAEAEALFRQALETRRRSLGARDQTTLSTLNNLALTLHAQSRFDEAERMYRQVLRARAGLEGPAADRDRSATQLNLAWLLSARGEARMADSAFEAVLELRRRLYTGDHALVARSLLALASSRRRVGRLGEADSLAREGLAMSRRLFGAVHASHGEGLDILAGIAKARGEFERATALYEEALEMWRRTRGAESQAVALTLANLGSLLNDRREYARAEPANREARELYRTILGEEHPFTGIALHNLARSLHGLGQHQSAEAHYRAALATLAEAYGKGSPRPTTTRLWLAELLMDRGDPAAAEPLLRDGLAARRESLPAGAWEIAYAQAQLGRCLLGLDRRAEAEALLSESHARLWELFGESDPRTAYAARYLSELRQGG